MDVHLCVWIYDLVCASARRAGTCVHICRPEENFRYYLQKPTHLLWNKASLWSRAHNQSRLVSWAAPRSLCLCFPSRRVTRAPPHYPFLCSCWALTRQARALTEHPLQSSDPVFVTYERKHSEHYFTDVTCAWMTSTRSSSCSGCGIGTRTQVTCAQSNLILAEGKWFLRPSIKHDSTNL